MNVPERTAFGANASRPSLPRPERSSIERLARKCHGNRGRALPDVPGGDNLPTGNHSALADLVLAAAERVLGSEADPLALYLFAADSIWNLWRDTSGLTV